MVDYKLIENMDYKINEPNVGGIPVAGYPASDTSILVSALYTVFMSG
jgi:hypothetical protein